jgi:hypothetical protein
MFEINPDGQHLTTPGENTPKRHAVLAKTTNYLFDNLALANEKFFRKLTADAVTDSEYGQIQILAAANFLRYIIHSNVAEESVDEVITNVMLGMKEAPPHIERPENVEIDAKNKELEESKKPKIVLNDEVEVKKTQPIVSALVN